MTGPSWRRPRASPAPGSRLRGAGALLEPERSRSQRGEGGPAALEPDVSGASPQTGAAGETGGGVGRAKRERVSWAGARGRRGVSVTPTRGNPPCTRVTVKRLQWEARRGRKEGMPGIDVETLSSKTGQLGEDGRSRKKRTEAVTEKGSSPFQNLRDRDCGGEPHFAGPGQGGASALASPLAHPSVPHGVPGDGHSSHPPDWSLRSQLWGSGIDGGVGWSCLLARLWM